MMWPTRPQPAAEPATGATNAPTADAGATEVQIAAEPFRCAQPNCGHAIQDHTDRALFGPGCAPPIAHGTASYVTGRCGCPGWRMAGEDVA